MRNAAIFGLVFAILCGCSGDPESSILPAGSQAVVVGTTSGIAWLETGAEGEARSLMLEPGARVTIGADPGGPEPWHPVRVVVETGAHRDASGSIARDHLKPIR